MQGIVKALTAKSTVIPAFEVGTKDRVTVLTVILAKAGVVKGPEKMGTTKDTKSTKKSLFFLYVLCGD